jgi:hypothetical protein
MNTIITPNTYLDYLSYQIIDVEDKSFKFKTKDFINDSTKKVYSFFKRPETKIASLVSYWAVEATFTLFAFYSFVKLGMIGTAALSVLLFAYITYATFGVIGEVR